MTQTTTSEFFDISSLDFHALLTPEQQRNVIALVLSPTDPTIVSDQFADAILHLIRSEVFDIYIEKLDGSVDREKLQSIDADLLIETTPGSISIKTESTDNAGHGVSTNLYSAYENVNGTETVNLATSSSYFRDDENQSFSKATHKITLDSLDLDQIRGHYLGYLWYEREDNPLNGEFVPLAIICGKDNEGYMGEQDFDLPLTIDDINFAYQLNFEMLVVLRLDTSQGAALKEQIFGGGNYSSYSRSVKLNLEIDSLMISIELSNEEIVFTVLNPPTLINNPDPDQAVTYAQEMKKYKGLGFSRSDSGNQMELKITDRTIIGQDSSKIPFNEGIAVLDNTLAALTQKTIERTLS